MSIRKTLACSLAALSLLFSSTALAVAQLEILHIYVDQDQQLIYITGRNMMNGNALEVNLGDGTMGSLVIQTHTDDLIIAEFPDGGIDPGDYLVTITTGGGTVRYAEYPLTFGAMGPPGPAGPQGETGATGPTGLTGPTGHRTYRSNGTRGAGRPSGSTGRGRIACRATVSGRFVRDRF
jgi:hypothetical protein